MNNFDVLKKPEGLEDITFSEYEKSDYEGYLSCLKDFFHNGYPYIDYLNKDTLHKMIDSGELLVVIAKNEEGKVIGTTAGHCIAGKKGKSVHLMLRCISEEYKKRGIAAFQETILLDLICKRYSSARSIGAEVVTNKVYSLITLSRQGFVFSGMCYMVYKNQVLMPRLEFEEESRMSLAIYTKALTNNPVKISVPHKHFDIIKSFYDELNVECSLFNDEPIKKEIKYHIVDYKEHQTAEIFIDENGSFSDNLTKDIKNLLNKNYTLNVFFDVSSEGCQSQYKYLENLNFYFAGIKPLAENGEMLIMSNTDNHNKGFENIAIPDEKRNIINYTLGERP